MDQEDGEVNVEILDLQENDNIPDITAEKIKESFVVPQTEDSTPSSTSSSDHAIEMQTIKLNDEDETKQNENDWMIPPTSLAEAVITKDKLKLKKPSVRKFYKNQNEIVTQILDTIDSAHRDSGEDEEKQKEIKLQNQKAKIAIYASLAVNIFLFFAKLYAAIISGSLSVVASSLDSFLDLLSGAIIFVTELLTRTASEYDFPGGKSRFEPIGILIFASCMFTATFQVITQAGKTLIQQNSEIDITLPTLIILAITIGLKLGLYLYCRTVSGSESVEALAMDHRNDVLSNSIAITTALIGYYYWWPLDPIGAIVIGLYIMLNWATTGYEQLITLVGRSAPPSYLMSLTWLARNHDKRVLAIDTVRAYHHGYKYLVEMDIVLPKEMQLEEAHDIGESLQNKLESLDTVERAFVHLDYEVTHRPEHSSK